MTARDRPATVQDVHDLAAAMPHVTREGSSERPVYQVGGKSFVFFRTPRPDALDASGARLPDVIVIWVADEAEKQALIQDPRRPFFTSDHFDGHPSVLVQACRLGELGRAEVAEIIADAWLARASTSRQREWLAKQ